MLQPGLELILQRLSIFAKNNQTLGLTNTQARIEGRWRRIKDVYDELLGNWEFPDQLSDEIPPWASLCTQQD